MTYGAAERVWNGETCYHCGKDLKREASSYDGNYFCSDYCLGAHLIEEHEDDIEWIDFVTQGEIDERMREIHDEQMNDGGY